MTDEHGVPPPQGPPLPPPGYPGYPPPPGYPPTYPPRPRTNGMATASMILGIASLVLAGCLWFFPILPILAIVFGHVSLTQINRQGTSGKGMAIAGMVTGYVGLFIALLVLLLVFLGTINSPTPTF